MWYRGGREVFKCCSRWDCRRAQHPVEDVAAVCEGLVAPQHCLDDTGLEVGYGAQVGDFRRPTRHSLRAWGVETQHAVHYL